MKCDVEDVIHTASGWLEDQDQEFFYNGTRLWKNCGPRQVHLLEGPAYVEN